MSDLQRIIVIVILCTVLGIVLWWFVNPPAQDPGISEAAPSVSQALVPQASQESHPGGHPEPKVPNGEEEAGEELASVPGFHSPGPDTGRIELLVIEEGTREPVPHVFLVVFHNPRENTRFGSVDAEFVTDRYGVVVMEDVPPGTARLRIGEGGMRRMSTREPLLVDLEVTGGETTYHTQELPARVEFKYRLVREDGTPVGHYDVKAGYDVAGPRNSRIQRLEPVRTRADGTFVLRAPPDEMRHVLAAENVLFRTAITSDSPTIDWWSNPYAWSLQRNQDPDSPREIAVRTEQVTAVGRLVNRTKYGDEWRHFARIQIDEGRSRYRLGEGSAHMREIGPDSTVRFVAPPGETVTIAIERHRDMWSPKEMLTAFDHHRTGTSSFGLPIETIVDHFVTVMMPDEGSLYEFEIVYEDRYPIEVRVLKPGDKPAEGVVVVATMADTLEMAQGLRVGSVPRHMPVYGNVATDTAGVARLELPEEAHAVLRLVPGSLPPEAQTFQPVVQEWRELQEGVTLRLGHSHLVWGEVVDEEGNPIHGAYINLGGGHVWREARGAGTRSNEEGIFELNIADGPDAAAAMRADVHVQAVVPWRNPQEPWDLLGVAPCELDSAEPVRIVMHRSTVFRLEVRSGGVSLEEYDLVIRYDHPDFARVHGPPMATTVRPQYGTHSTGRLPLGKATLLVKHPGDSMDRAVEVVLPETNSSTYNRLTVDLPE